MKIFFLLLVLIVSLLAYVRFAEKTAIYFPSKDLRADPSEIGAEYEDIYFHSSDNFRLHGWLVKSPGADITMIFLHGNAGNISDRLEKIDIFRRMGLNVFIIDYFVSILPQRFIPYNKFFVLHRTGRGHRE